MRDRPILGLPIMQGLTPSAANQWKGNIYNPEDGNTYSVTLTLVSRNQINIRGCKGWILCGERTWLRTSLPKPEPEEEPQIEASAEPDAAVQPESATAAAEPEKAAPQAKEDVFAEAQMLTPAVETNVQPGYRFLNASATGKPAAGLSGENVPSMFVMTTPIRSEATGAADKAPTETAAATRRRCRRRSPSRKRPRLPLRQRRGRKRRLSRPRQRMLQCPSRRIASPSIRLRPRPPRRPRSMSLN